MRSPKTRLSEASSCITSYSVHFIVIKTAATLLSFLHFWIAFRQLQWSISIRSPWQFLRCSIPYFIICTSQFCHSMMQASVGLTAQSYRKVVTTARRDKKAAGGPKGLTEEQKQEIRFVFTPCHIRETTCKMNRSFNRSSLKMMWSCANKHSTFTINPHTTSMQRSIRSVRYRWQRHYRCQGTQSCNAVRIFTFFSASPHPIKQFKNLPIIPPHKQMHDDQITQRPNNTTNVPTAPLDLSPRRKKSRKWLQMLIQMAPAPSDLMISSLWWPPRWRNAIHAKRSWRRSVSLTMMRPAKSPLRTWSVLPRSSERTSAVCHCSIIVLLYILCCIVCAFFF